MIVGIDHIVILVHDLAGAQADYSALGFTVVPGGEHAGGATHNALVSFADGTYLELVAFKGEAPKDHFFYRAHGNEGLLTFALLPDNIEEDIAAARARGLEYDGPTPGGRARPDGQQISWQIGRPHTRDLPFLCADVTPRELRVPGGAATEHPNGVMGIANVLVLVQDLDSSVERYRALLGVEPARISYLSFASEDNRVSVFKVGGATVTLMEPVPGSRRDYLEARGEGPHSLSLRGSDYAPGFPDLARAHGAELHIAKS
jgi:catechol 2,3-dioxygenase-like lactoylglutathione lyase family enzyme